MGHAQGREGGNKVNHIPPEAPATEMEVYTVPWNLNLIRKRYALRILV